MKQKSVGFGLLVAWMMGCGNTAGPDKSPSGSKVDVALVVTSDYQTGSYATIEVKEHRVFKDIQSIHADAVCRFDTQTGLAYVVSRLGMDAIEVVHPDDSFSIGQEYSVEAGSNPQDIAIVSDQKAYVTRFGLPTLLVVHPTKGTVLKEIDLSDYADEDGLSESVGALHVNGKVYVTLQRLVDFAPTDHSVLLVIDASTDEIESMVRLSGTNPVTKLRYSESIQRIVLGEVGNYGQLDGGVEYFDPVNGQLSGFVIDETALEGDLGDVVIHSAKKGYAIIASALTSTGMATSVVAFNPTSGVVTDKLIESDGYYHAFLELTPDGSQLWVSERKREQPGVRVFRTQDNRQITQQPIDVGLPPNMICFVPQD